MLEVMVHMGQPRCRRTAAAVTALATLLTLGACAEERAAGPAKGPAEERSAAGPAAKARDGESVADFLRRTVPPVPAGP